MEIRCHHGEQMWYPAVGLSKQDVFDYYHFIGPRMLPFLTDRPVTLQRCPDGIQGECFYQKRPSSHFPDWLARVTVPQKTHPEPITYMLIQDMASLLYLVDQGTICFHRQLATQQHIDMPTHMVFDLDPTPGTSIELLREGVRLIHAMLDDHGLPSSVMTTGGSGFHILVELKELHVFAEVKQVIHGLADELLSHASNLFTTKLHKADRDAPIYLDLQRNNYGQTAVCPYSLRAKPGATIAMPFAWEELDVITPDRFMLVDVLPGRGILSKI